MLVSLLELFEAYDLDDGVSDDKFECNNVFVVCRSGIRCRELITKQTRVKQSSRKMKGIIIHWSGGKFLLTNIWKLAGCILAIPATSAPSERVFSAAAIQEESTLNPETLDLLLFMRGIKNFVI